jgi:hypothetical protein
MLTRSLIVLPIDKKGCGSLTADEDHRSRRKQIKKHDVTRTYNSPKSAKYRPKIRQKPPISYKFRPKTISGHDQISSPFLQKTLNFVQSL